MRHTRTALTALLATAALGLIVTTATAGRLSFSNQNFRAVWTSLEFETSSRNGKMLCPITIEGSFHNRSIAKRLGDLVGYITRATVTNPCNGGSATVLTETLPWHIIYNGFEGTLPNISGTRFNLIGVSFRIFVGESGLECLAASTSERPMRGTVNINAAHEALTLTPDRTAQIPLTGGICSLTRGIILENRGTVSVLGNNNSITITLI